MADCSIWLYRTDNRIEPTDKVYVFCKTHDVLIDEVTLTPETSEKEYAENVTRAIEEHKEKHGQGKQTEEQGT